MMNMLGAPRVRWGMMSLSEVSEAGRPKSVPSQEGGKHVEIEHGRVSAMHDDRSCILLGFSYLLALWTWCASIELNYGQNSL